MVRVDELLGARDDVLLLRSDADGAARQGARAALLDGDHLHAARADGGGHRNFGVTSPN